MARFFDDMNRSDGVVCPICKTDGPGKVLLVPIPGTVEGNVQQAQQLHADCAYLVGSEYYYAMRNEEAEAMEKSEAAMEKAQASRDKARDL